MVTPDVMHSRSVSYAHSDHVVHSNFEAYTRETLEAFKGESDSPRMICGIPTREYVVIPVRYHREEDGNEIIEVASKLKGEGFYTQVLGTRGTKGATAYTSMAMLVCWDPQIINAEAAEDVLCDQNSFALYGVIMQYVNAEKSLSGIPASAKVNMEFNGVRTAEWVCISIITEESYREIPVVGRYLWNLGYRIGVQNSTRRAGTWVLFVCWDPKVVEAMPECDGDFAFKGKVPDNWS